MKKPLKILVLGLALIMSLSVFTGCDKNKGKEALNAIVIGDSFEIMLEAYSGTAYVWDYEITPATGIEYVSRKYIAENDDPNWAGGGELVYTFKATVTGEFTIKFVLKELHNTTPIETKIYTISVKNECHKSYALSATYQENFSKSKEAYDAAIIDFTVSDGVYTDDFGGVFIDRNGIFNICVVGSLIPTNTEYLIFEKVDNSLNFLKSVSEELTDNMLTYNIWSVGICEECNKVKICIEDKNQINSIINHLKNVGLFKDNSLMFFESPNLNTPS